MSKSKKNKGRAKKPVNNINNRPKVEEQRVANAKAVECVTEEKDDDTVAGQSVNTNLEKSQKSGFYACVTMAILGAVLIVFCIWDGSHRKASASEEQNISNPSSNVSSSAEASNLDDEKNAESLKNDDATGVEYDNETSSDITSEASNEAISNIADEANDEIKDNNTASSEKEKTGNIVGEAISDDIVNDAGESVAADSENVDKESDENSEQETSSEDEDILADNKDRDGNEDNSSGDNNQSIDAENTGDDLDSTDNNSEISDNDIEDLDSKLDNPEGGLDDPQKDLDDHVVGSPTISEEEDNERYLLITGLDKQKYTVGNMPEGYKSEAQALAHMTTITVKVWRLRADNTRYSSNMSLTINKELAESVKEIFEEIYELEIQFPIKQLVGFVYRKVGGVGLVKSKLMSVHSFGAAIDINPGDYDNDYYLGKGNDLRDKDNPYCIPDEVIEIFEKHGWFWGGNFDISSDTMHFQFFGLDFLQYDDPDEPFPVLSKGSTDNAYEALVNMQQRLVKLGYLDKLYDSFNSKVKKAVKAFQKDYELEANGVVNYATWEKMINLTHDMSYVF